ncbi:hypothetical protein TYRP_010100 [Tyrophagus putrescentiae]|nr:hypothetical protein TYRP_010100 [Tyrophagus putrescentiae]
MLARHELSALCPRKHYNSISNSSSHVAIVKTAEAFEGSLLDGLQGMGCMLLQTAVVLIVVACSVLSCLSQFASNYLWLFPLHCITQ